MSSRAIRDLWRAIQQANNIRTALRIVFLEAWDRITLGAILVALLLSAYVAYAKQQVVNRIEQEKGEMHRVLEQYRTDNTRILEELRAIQEATRQYTEDNRAMFEFLRRIEEEPCPSRK